VRGSGLWAHFNLLYYWLVTCPRLLLDGSGATLNGIPPDEPPPGPGLNTLRLYVPGGTIKAGITTVNCVGLTNVVLRTVWPICATAPETKLVPASVIGTAPISATTIDGFADVKVADGLSILRFTGTITLPLTAWGELMVTELK
jgi:hypothetical protein